MSELDCRIHGLRLKVTTDHPALAAALSHRLRAWQAEPSADAELQLDFTTRSDPRANQPDRIGVSRPVYDTPDGQVVYWPELDAVDAEFGQVSMRGDVGAGLATISSPSFEDADRYLAAHPLTMLALTELLRRQGLYPVHAGCVAQHGRGVLVAGPSGSGKSTLTLALVKAGFQFLSDDLVFLSDEPGRTEVLGFPDAVGVTTGTVDRFDELSQLKGREPDVGWRKHVIRIEDHFAVELIPSCTPVALIFPEITPGPSRLEPLDPGEAWLRLVPDVLLTEPAVVQTHLRLLAEFSGGVCCYRLHSGPDLNQSTALIAEMLA